MALPEDNHSNDIDQGLIFSAIGYTSISHVNAQGKTPNTSDARHIQIDLDRRASLSILLETAHGENWDRNGCLLQR